MKSAVDKVHRFDGMTFLENDDDLGVLYDMDDRLINDEEIRNGIIKQNPYVNDSFNTTCQYCEYSQICGIFENIEERRPEIQGRDSAEKLWSKKIGGEEV